MYNLLYVIPKNLLSYLVGFLVSVKWPRFMNEPLKKWFVQRYQIDMNEAEYPIESYNSLGDLFTRRLKPGLRPIGSGFVHPCDAKLTQGGIILDGQMIQAKGLSYSLQEFLANQEGWKDFENGHYLTYYLCPTDYHRVHTPVSGRVLSCTHVPGLLWPVNDWSVKNIANLFSINERTVTIYETERGKLALVMVGATNVGKISMSFDAEMVTNQSHFRPLKHKNYKPAIELEKGAELGIFHMGSTVIVLTTPGYFETLPEGFGQQTRMGEKLSLKQD